MQEESDSDCICHLLFYKFDGQPTQIWIGWAGLTNDKYDDQTDTDMGPSAAGSLL